MTFTASALDRLNNERREAPVPMRTIKGHLIPSDSEAAKDDFIRYHFRAAFNGNQLDEMVRFHSKWDGTGITFNSSAPLYAGKEDVEKFLNSLNNIFQTEAATKLGLNGWFRVVIDTGTAPTILRITVKDSEVSYQKAEYLWPAPVTMPRIHNETEK